MGKEESAQPESNGRVGIFRLLLSFAGAAEVAQMAVGTVAAVANGLPMPLMTLFAGDAIQAFGSSGRGSVIHEVNKVVMKFVYLAIAAGVASFLQVSCWMVAGERQAIRIRELYLSAILRQDIAFFDEGTTTGEVIGRMSGDTILIQEAIGENVGKFVQLMTKFIGGFVVAFTRGWMLALVMMSSIPVIAIAGASSSWVISKLSVRSQAAYAEAGNIVDQTVGSIRTVVSFTGEKQAVEKYKKLIRDAYKSSVQEGTASGLGIGCFQMCMFCSYGLSVWYGSKLILDKGYRGGDVITILMAIMIGAMSLGQVSPCLKAFGDGQAAAFKMFETINRKPEIDVYDMTGLMLEDIRGDIKLENVCFRYPARPEHLIFDGLSLHVPSGTTTALVGESGSGKSTVVSLVERFYDPQSGEVLIDGINLKKLNLRWIRGKIGLVNQEPVLFTTTIKENIAFGKEGATLEEIKRACELSNVMKFINRLPHGLDTMVGEHGTQLSGGQKQRIAIARAVLKNPKILLLDEATSALDAESERIVQDALTRISADRTTIIVAHRLSTVKHANVISVVHKGKIIEQGSHSELITDPDGAYSQLIHMQEVGKQAEEASFRHPTNTILSSDSEKYHHKSWSKSIYSSGGSSSFFESPLLNSPGSTVFDKGDTKGPHKVNESKRDSNEKPGKTGSIKRLAHLNKPELPVLLLGSIFAAMNGMVFPVFAILLSTAIKIFYEPPQELMKDARFWSLMYLILGIICLLIVPAQHYLFGVAGGKLIERIRYMSFESVVHQEISWFDETSNSSGVIGARLSADAATVRGLVGDTLGLMVQNLSTVIAGISIALIANWRLTLLTLGLLPMLGLQAYAQIRFLNGFSSDAKVMYQEASQVANDAINSIRTVASFCSEKKVMDTYEGKCETAKRHGVRKGIVSGLGFGFSHSVVFFTNALLFYIGAQFIHHGLATFAQVFRVFTALTVTSVGVSQTSAVAQNSTKAKESAASIFDILDRRSKIDSSSDYGKVLPDVRGDIEFRHISFKYPSRPQVLIFKDLCLKIPSGKSVALVGESGSGKSTVISLLERFYDPDNGVIRLDGVNIKRLNVNWLRQQIALVSQEPALFTGTIRSNIAYGKKEETSEDEIMAAAKAANAHRFISSLPQGYDTSVGEKGIQLSGGQKQRVAIARAVLKDPRILLLDEATSALDAESEHVVQEALDRMMVGRSTVVVAHRLYTIQGANIIAVIKDGVVKEQGCHEVLMDVPDGVYASLVAVQKSSG